MKNKLLSENYWSDLLLIASTILFQLILVTCQITYVPLMRLMKEIQFLLAVHFIFTFLILLPQRSEIFQK